MENNGKTKTASPLLPGYFVNPFLEGRAGEHAASLEAGSLNLLSLPSIGEGVVCERE